MKRKFTEDTSTTFQTEISKCNPRIQEEFFKIKREIEKNEPSIMQIMNTPLLDQDKAALVQLFEVYTEYESICLEKIDLKQTIKTRFVQSIQRYRQHNRYTKEEHTVFDKSIEEMTLFGKNEELKYDILKLSVCKTTKQIIYNEYLRMTEMQPNNEELCKIRNWLYWAVSLPYDKVSTPVYNTNDILCRVQKKMDEELYGMAKAKEQILLFLNSRLLNPSMKKCSLGLLGVPGCGKTTIVKLLADMLEFPLEQISLGGIGSADFLKGHQYTYIGAEPGEVVKCLCRMKVKNGILFFDEYDKVSGNKDVCSALLHITDSTQNNKFRDNFLSGIDIDLAHLWFFYSMNSQPTDNALSDRIFYVNIDSYNKEDKFCIVKDYLLKKVHKNMGWVEGSVQFTNEAINFLVEKSEKPELNHNSGIRFLDFVITEIANKINFLYHHQNKKGKLENFKMSFDIGIKINFPFVLEKKDLERML